MEGAGPRFEAAKNGPLAGGKAAGAADAVVGCLLATAGNGIAPGPATKWFDAVVKGTKWFQEGLKAAEPAPPL